MIAPDQTTIDYVKGRPAAPSGSDWDKAVEYWLSLRSDPDAKFDREVYIDGSTVLPTVTWGTSPEQTVPITGKVPDPAAVEPLKRRDMEKALEYMGLEAGTPMEGIRIDQVFIGSCTNSRIEDMREVAKIAKGRKVADHVQAMIVPGSGLVKQQAEAEGLDAVFAEAGFDWREPGCSMCLGMNPDRLKPGERCASTSNRNFEGRQGPGGRTHLLSPAMAAAAAVTGHLVDVRTLELDVSAASEIQNRLDGKVFVGEAGGVPASPLARDTPQEGSGGSAGMLVFDTLKGHAVPMPAENIDTDQIFPGQFLKTIKRSGLAYTLFHGHRYQADGSDDPSFILNQPPYNNARILVAGDNFGCGSSREHAPWALADFGIRCIVSTSFADIFYNNCFKNGMLPITLPKVQVDRLMADAVAGDELTVDLHTQQIVRANGETVCFAGAVDDFKRHCLLNGLDDIGLTILKDGQISLFEEQRSSSFPWLDGPGYQAML